MAGTFREREGFHGCQMPEQLLGRIIRACSREGEAVLDPFGGSGTTLAVAKKLGRKYLGFELSADYVEKVNRREPRVVAGMRGQALPAASRIREAILDTTSDDTVFPDSLSAQIGVDLTDAPTGRGSGVGSRL